MFGVNPWQMLFLDDMKRTWYEMATIRHRNREHEMRQQFLNAIAQIMGAEGGDSGGSVEAVEADF